MVITGRCSRMTMGLLQAVQTWPLGLLPASRSNTVDERAVLPRPPSLLLDAMGIGTPYEITTKAYQGREDARSRVGMVHLEAFDTRPSPRSQRPSGREPPERVGGRGAIGPVAQGIERGAPDAKARGSNPLGVTHYTKTPAQPTEPLNSGALLYGEDRSAWFRG